MIGQRENKLYGIVEKGFTNEAILSDESIWVKSKQLGSVPFPELLMDSHPIISAFLKQLRANDYNPNLNRRLTEYEEIERAKIVSMLFRTRREHKGQQSEVFLAISLFDSLIWLYRQFYDRQGIDRSYEMKRWFRLGFFAYSAYSLLNIVRQMGSLDVFKTEVVLKNDGILKYNQEMFPLMILILFREYQNIETLYDWGIKMLRKWTAFVVSLGKQQYPIDLIAYNHWDHSTAVKKPQLKKLLGLFQLSLQAAVHVQELLSFELPTLSCLCLYYAINESLGGSIGAPLMEVELVQETAIPDKFSLPILFQIFLRKQLPLFKYSQYQTKIPILFACIPIYKDQELYNACKESFYDQLRKLNPYIFSQTMMERILKVGTKIRPIFQQYFSAQ